MKIGIITLNGYVNLGNRLQNYALQEVLKSLDSEVETVLVDEKEIVKPLSIIRKIKLTIRNIVKGKPDSELLEKKIEKFKIFTNKYIKETSYKISRNNLHEEKLESFDYFIVGSDQVWNPYYNGGSSIYFLTFAPIEKRLTYAPSISIPEIPTEFVGNYKQWLKEFNALSIRENEGAALIHSLIDKNSKVVVDPTLLLTKEEWLSISKKPKAIPEKKYLLTYFLGGVPEEYKNQIQTLALKYSLEIVNLGDQNEPENFIIDPSEFIYYLNKCSLMCTDSFHGTVFSILLEKPFIVYERVGNSSMYSRITTLLEKFDLNSRAEKNIKLESNILQIDFSNVQLILNTEKQESIKFLKNSIGRGVK